MAEKFGKRHDSILRDIDNLISDSTKVWSETFARGVILILLNSEDVLRNWKGFMGLGKVIINTAYRIIR